MVKQAVEFTADMFENLPEDLTTLPSYNREDMIAQALKINLIKDKDDPVPEDWVKEYALHKAMEAEHSLLTTKEEKRKHRKSTKHDSHTPYSTLTHTKWGLPVMIGGTGIAATLAALAASLAMRAWLKPIVKPLPEFPPPPLPTW